MILQKLHPRFLAFASLTFFAGLTLTLSFLGCSGPPADARPSVLATTSIIADAAKRIGGEHVRVECLMGPGIDPHRYGPTPTDIGKISSARLVLFNGLHLEGKMVDVLEKPARGRKSVAVTRSLDASQLRSADIDGGAHDPHVWFDVKLWMKCVEVIRDELCELDPDYAADFQANATTYLKELEALDREVREAVAKLPTDRRVLVTGHDAFGYFGAAYGFDVYGLQGVSTAGETSTQDVMRLADVIGGKKVPTVFTETSVPTKGLEQVLSDVRRRFQHDVRLAAEKESLYSDALGEPGSSGDSYIGMVRYNVTVIVNALK